MQRLSFRFDVGKFLLHAQDFTVAILGLSVGSNIAFVLSQSGISGNIIIADNDELDTSNLNRILAGVHQVGIGKTEVAARRMYEANPFIKVDAMSEGVTPENLELLLKEKRLNCIIEEIDELPMKIAVRKMAMEYKVPVVMITDNGDGVVLHIERYDLGYDKVFNKPLAYWDALSTGKPTPQDMGMMIVNDIIGGMENVAPRVMESVQRVLRHELVSWSQLGSAAIFGGVIATVAVKKIALGTSTEPYIALNIQPPL